MAEVFELFNESPLKAIAKFRKMYDDAGEPFILELKKR